MGMSLSEKEWEYNCTLNSKRQYTLFFLVSLKSNAWNGARIQIRVIVIWIVVPCKQSIYFHLELRVVSRTYLVYRLGWQIWKYLLKLTPPIESRTVTQAAKQIVETMSHKPGRMSKYGFPFTMPRKIIRYQWKCVTNMQVGHEFVVVPYVGWLTFDLCLTNSSMINADLDLDEVCTSGCLK